MFASRVPPAAVGWVRDQATPGRYSRPLNLRHKRPEVIPSSESGKAEGMPETISPSSAEWFAHSQRALTGNLLTLEPLSWKHASELLAIASDDRIWYFLTSCAMTEDALSNYISDALSDRDAGTAIPFVVRWRQSGKLVGSTRLKYYSSQHQKAMIGSWFVPSVWGKGANPESKLLLLSLAFETLECIRIEFNTDGRNHRSRAALKALGAFEEGTLRSWGATRRGDRRDNVVFSILRQEWPETKQRLLSRLNGSRYCEASATDEDHV
ncbi:GNAT family N-acetyltransferase [Acidobacteria bacterium AB60]|nr:GNAT family N-acetyltransferase [Acidobacteria bacterium AB60]